MDSYIVRIYRRRPIDLSPEHGVIEGDDGRRMASFSSPDELWAFLIAVAQMRDVRTTNVSKRRKR